MYDLSKVVVTSSPHIKSDEDTRSVMFDVIIALLPALAVAFYTFGPRALVITALTVAACVVSEWAYCRVTGRGCTIGDCSAIVTGLLLAYNVPVTAPVWMPVIGGVFAIIVVKMLFGGIGKNFINPALGGRAFMMASWTALMTSFVAPHTKLSAIGSTADAVTSATPLAALKNGQLPDASMLDLLLGQHGGVIGETCALALLAGGAYLLVRKVITINIPAAYILTVAVLTFLFPMGGQPRLLWMLSQVFSGGLLLGAFFMATDYATSPVTPKGQIVFGVGCGLLTVFIRYFGGYPEGVSYSILIMNSLVWAIDAHTHPRKFGYPAKAAKKEVQG